MVVGRQKSRTMRRVYVKTPGGKTKLHFRLRKPSKAHCADCGGLLAGVPALRPFRMSDLAKTSKRPERAFGGVLCSYCSRRAIISKTRK